MVHGRGAWVMVGGNLKNLDFIIEHNSASRLLSTNHDFHLCVSQKGFLSSALC